MGPKKYILHLVGQYLCILSIYQNTHISIARHNFTCAVGTSVADTVATLMTTAAILSVTIPVSLAMTVRVVVAVATAIVVLAFATA